jgi:hypothetical protein
LQVRMTLLLQLERKKGVGLCWDKFGQNVHWGFRWLFPACSSCHFQALHTTNTQLLLSEESSGAYPSFGVKKRRKACSPWKKEKMKDASIWSNNWNIRWPQVLGICLRSVTSAYFSLDAVYTGVQG